MKKNERIAILIFSSGVLIFIGFLFWPFVLENIIMPIALTVWLLLRVFVLSIDQALIWIFLIVLGAFYLLMRLRGRPGFNPPEETREINAMMNNISLWRIWIQFGASDVSEVDTIRRELTFMLVSMFKSRQRGIADFEVVEALKKREITVPEPVYAFLFPVEPDLPENSWLRKARLLQQAPQKWIRRWTGRELAEFYKAIDDVLMFMETSLELTNDSKSFETGHD